MWVVLKFDKNNLELLKGELKKKLGNDFSFYNPKFFLHTPFGLPIVTSNLIYSFDNKKVISARDEIKTRLREHNIPCYGETGNYLLIDLGDSNKCASIAKILEADSIYVKSNYPKPWDSYILITVGPIEIMDRFLSVFFKNV